MIRNELSSVKIEERALSAYYLVKGARLKGVGAVIPTCEAFWERQTYGDSHEIGGVGCKWREHRGF